MTNHEYNATIVMSIVFGGWCALALTCLVVARWSAKRKAKKEQRADLTTVGNGSTPAYMDHRQRDVHHLFHTLWTKAVGTDNYNKSEWKQLGDYLYALLDEPEASQKIAKAPVEVPPPTRFEREDVL